MILSMKVTVMVETVSLPLPPIVYLPCAAVYPQSDLQLYSCGKRIF